MNTRKLNNLVLAAALQAATLTGLATTASAGEGNVALEPLQATQSQALNEAIQAHGGIKRWRSYGRMDYRTSDFPLGANAPFDFTQTTDLHNRRHVTTGEGFTAGKNDREAWAYPNVQALGIPPAFFESGNFYFITMPFVFADPGAIARDLDPIRFDGKDYDRVAISYESGIGSTPEDDYVLYIEQDTHRLRMIDFVPTSAEINGDTPKDQLPRKALVFEDWQDADGLLIPSRATFYGWADGQLQGDGNSYTIDNVSFTKLAPNPAVFEQSSHSE